ncbi:unnamed protein product [Effrenium voratum]|nr:unnamed protein product [Effrenium voratum]
MCWSVPAPQAFRRTASSEAVGEAERCEAEGIPVCSISGRCLLEQRFLKRQTLEDVKTALRPQVEPLAQLRLISSAQEVPEDAVLQDLCDAEGTVSLTVLRVLGHLALTGNTEGTLQLWDLDDGRCVHTMGQGGSHVSGLEVDWENRRALSGDLHHTVRLWDLEEGRLVHCMPGHESIIRGVEVDWARDRAATYDAVGLLICWDLSKGEAEHMLLAHEGGVLDIDVDWKEMRILSVGADFAVKAWVQGQELWARQLSGNCGLERLVDAGLEADWAKDRLALCWDMSVHLWDLKTGELLHSLTGHGDHIKGFSVDWETQRCISWGEDGLVLLWDLQKGNLQQQLLGHQEAVTGALCNWEPLGCLSFSSDCTLRLWTPTKSACLEGHSDLVCGAEVCWEQSRAFSWSDDSTLRLWDLQAGACLQLFEGHQGPVWAAHVDWEGGRALSYSFAHRVLLLWSFEGGMQRISLEDDGASPADSLIPAWLGGADVNWSRQRALAWCLSDGLIRAVDLPKQRLRRLTGHGKVSCARLEGDSEL